MAPSSPRSRKLSQDNLRDWWTEQDAKAYEQLGKCICDEYTQEITQLGVKTNELLTQDEDTANNGWARLALMALEELYAGSRVAQCQGVRVHVHETQE